MTSTQNEMQYVRLGNTGTKVSRICLGCMSFGSKKWREWALEEDDSRKIIKRALELGINFFDTANMYSLGESERILGAAIREYTNREDVVIASKVYFPMSDKPNDRGLSRKHIMHSIDETLKRLGTHYIDLYQIHRWDNETPIEETLEALNDLIRIGKVRYIGASSMYTFQFAKAIYTARNRGWNEFITMQNHYNLIYREEEREMIPFCKSEKIGLLPWSPLARGFLCGTRKKEDKDSPQTLRGKTDDFAKKMYYQPEDYEIEEVVAKIAKEKNVSQAQIALSWMLHKPEITAPIIGVTKVSQLEDLVGALKVKLSEDDIKRLEEPYKPKGVLGGLTPLS